MLPKKLYFAQLKATQFPVGYESNSYKQFWKPTCCAKDSQEYQKPRFNFVGQSLFDKWKLGDIKANGVQEKLSGWFEKTQKFVNDVATPLVPASQTRKSVPENVIDDSAMEDIMVADQTISSKTPQGILSIAAIVSIEQFSRMNGLTAHRMQKVFKALVPESVHNDARNLIEYCCFRFLSRDSSAVHPSLKEPAFQKLVFITMVAWENPYSDEPYKTSAKASLQGILVHEEAFIRIAPTISGVADQPTVHSLFKALAGEEEGISLAVWLTYIKELLRVHERRRTYQFEKFPHLSERILCIGSNQKQPILKWEKNKAWPGKLTLTDRAIYFEAIGLFAHKESIRLDLTKEGVHVEKAKVGPLESIRFDSAVSISSSLESKNWVLEFVDLGGEMRRDVWHASISEIISLHRFIRDYGPREGDESILYVYGARRGEGRAITSSLNCIARLQALQFMRKIVEDPVKLVQFSYLNLAPYGHVVSQTLAVNFWGGPLVTKLVDAQPVRLRHNQARENSNHLSDFDGSVYLRKWTKSPSWSSKDSLAFWKNFLPRDGVVLSKNLVVADTTLVAMAAEICRRKHEVLENTQATIDAATLTGIPSNIDLFKELVLPLAITAKKFEKLRRWEEPHLTVSFLALAYTVIFRNLLSYVLPTVLIISAATMLSLKRLKEQGRLGRSFGKVTIRDQPPSNTIQKIIAVKDAMRDVESYLQNINVALLKMRTVILSGHPQVTTEVALGMLFGATVLLTVRFKYVLAFFIFDLFTRELDFRKEMVMKFITLLKQRWDMVPASPVVVLPFQTDEPKLESPLPGKQTKDQAKLGKEQGSNLNK